MTVYIVHAGMTVFRVCRNEETALRFRDAIMDARRKHSHKINSNVYVSRSKVDD